MLSWQMYRQMIPGLLPFGTKVASKSGRARRGRMDAGMVFFDDAPLYTLAAYTDQVPEVMPDGTPGYAAVYTTIARISQACWQWMIPGPVSQAAH